jgi:unconventional prefoldin RPB5 interactor 1
MATSAQQTMANVERQRLQLEENVAKLSKALDHWAAWEVEYEMLKEELQKANSPSAPEMLEIGRDLGGTMVNEKEVQELLGKDPHHQRTANQVINLISRRLDYVQQNRETVEKQHKKAEKLLAGTSILADPGLENEEGLPMMDIEEELDEDGQVVSGSVMQPGKDGAKLIEALQKAGLHKDEQPTSENEEKMIEGVKSALATSSATTASLRKAVEVSSKSSVPSNSDKPPSKPAAVSNSTKKSKAAGAKKSVSFAEDIDVKTFEKPVGLKDDLKHWHGLKPGANVYELDEEGAIVSKVTVPDESVEDAKLRKEMLQYGLDEVGGVVAELDLEEGEDWDDDDDDDMDAEYDSNESEEEDEHGRSTKSELTEAYRKQMMELEKKLNARMLENVGPGSADHPLAEAANGVHRLRVRNDDEFDDLISNMEKTPTAAMPERTSESEPAQEPMKAAPTKTDTIADTIVERSGPTPQAPAPPSQPKAAKVSRFKSARASNNQPMPMLPTPPMPEPPPLPTGPAGRTLASTVVEHTPHPSDPQAPDEFDPVLINREVSREYHKMRNKMIQGQGGFTATDDDDEEDPIVEQKDGQTKKVSRFRAARLKADGL